MNLCVKIAISLISLNSAKDPDPLDPQDFGLLDPDPDPQKYADPRIRIQGAKYQPKTAQKNLLSKPKSELLKKERLKKLTHFGFKLKK